MHEIRVERVDSALSLNAFEHHGAAALFAERFESVEVSCFGIHESPGKRSEFGMEGILSGRGKCRHRSSVEAVFQRYHRGTALVAVFAESKTPCRLDRAFVRLGARIREEHLLHSRAPAKHLRKDCARLRIVKVRRMPAGVKLLLHRLDPFAVAHAEGIHGDSRSEVDVFPAVVADEHRAVTARHGQRKARVCRRDIFAVGFAYIHFPYRLSPIMRGIILSLYRFLRR